MLPVSSTIDTVTYASRDDDVDADIGGGADDVDGDDISADIDNMIGRRRRRRPLRRRRSPTGSTAGRRRPAGGWPGDRPDGADTFIGGADGTPGGQHTALKDLVTYFSRSDDVSVNLTSGVGGAPGEGDVIDPTMERVNGGAGDDTLTGDLEANRLEGANGDDVLIGSASATADAARRLRWGRQHRRG